MGRFADFALPDLGEGLTEGEILQWHVAPGDEVRLNQVIVEVETAKAAVEVPSPYAGVVHRIHHAAGTTVDVGAPLITFDTDPSAGADDAAAAPDSAGPPAGEQPVGGGPEDLVPSPPAPGDGALIGEVGANGRTATLVGYGPRSGPVTRRPRTDAPRSASAPPVPLPPARVSAQQVGAAAAVRAGGVAVRAKPPVRRLAKAHGVDLGRLRGSGPDGTITRADVEAALGPAVATGPAVGTGSGTPSGAPAAAGGETRVPVKGVRKATATAMVTSAFTAPHVTEFLTIDITPTMELRERVQALPEFAQVKVTPLLFVAKALLLAVRRSPEVNSTWDEQEQEIVVKDDVHLGIAAATPRGLLVPNIKDAGRLSMPQLAAALQALTETARAGRTPPADLTGGTITITNVGAFGVDSGTPILNPGEAAILCFGAVRPQPWVVQDRDGSQRIEVRSVTQLSLSFDHRIVDGQLGSAFLSDIGRVLSDPVTGLLWS